MMILLRIDLYVTILVIAAFQVVELSIQDMSPVWYGRKKCAFWSLLVSSMLYHCRFCVTFAAPFAVSHNEAVRRFYNVPPASAAHPQNLIGVFIAYIVVNTIFTSFWNVNNSFSWAWNNQNDSPCLNVLAFICDLSELGRCSSNFNVCRNSRLHCYTREKESPTSNGVDGKAESKSKFSATYISYVPLIS